MDQATFSASRQYVLLCYGCVAAAVVIVVLAIAFFQRSYAMNVDNVEAVAASGIAEQQSSIDRSLILVR